MMWAIVAVAAALALAGCSNQAAVSQAPQAAGTGTEAVAQGSAYMAENAKKPGVKTTPSGLQYEVLRAGTGKVPKLDGRATVHYEGTLISGKKFDSSYDRGEPSTFPLRGVIKGWTEGLLYMKEGAKFRFVIPPNLAYGAVGSPPAIGPNETLVFVVELIKAD